MPITAKINVTKILKEHLFEGKNGKYLDLVIFPNKEGKDQYGNTHYVVQGISKANREAGVKGPIIGNLRLEEGAPKPAAKPEAAAAGSEDGDDVPF